MTHKHWTSMALSALAIGMGISAPALVWGENPADTIPFGQIDNYLQANMQSRKIPGLAVAAVRDGALLTARSYGLASVELEAPNSPRSLFEIGSLSKQFTAAAVMMLIEQGKIALDDPILTIMPALPKNWSPVTVRHLLSHTSGIPSYDAVPGFWAARQSGTSRAGILASVAERPLRFKPGEKQITSSTDYFVLGLLIETLSGQSYQRFLTERIFQPFGLGSIRTKDYETVIKQRVFGYTVDEDGAYRNAVSTHPSRLFANGALMASVIDLARWEAALVAGKVVKRSTLAQMWAPTTLNDGTSTANGFGWRLRSTSPSSGVIQQIGGASGFRSQVVYNPSSGVTVIMLANSEAPNLTPLMDRVHQIIVSGETAVAR